MQRAFRKDPSLEMRKLGFGLLLLVDMVKVKMSGTCLLMAHGQVNACATA